MADASDQPGLKASMVCILNIAEPVCRFMRLPRMRLSQASHPGIRMLGILAWGTVALFGKCLQCLPKSPSNGSSPDPSLIPGPNDDSLGSLSDEFSGLDLRLNRARIQADVFTTESIAIAAIHAMKKSALEDYDGPLNHFDFTDILPPANPIRILMVPAPTSFVAPLKRSTVLWTLKSLTIDLLRMAILYPLSFQVRYERHDLYLGSLASPRLDVASRSLSHPLSLTTIPVQNSTSVILSTRVSLQYEPHYQINFNFVGEALSKIQIFGSILTLLLHLAKDDHLTVLPQTSMELRQIQARIFIRQVSPPPPMYRFQQYHAVALLEAIARYYVLHGQYTEMTFELIMNGYLVARGCVTRAVASRRWCGQMFLNARAGVNTPVATS